MTVLPYSALSHLECPRCRARHDADRVQGTCRCGSPLLARYDLGLAASGVSPRDIAGRPPDLWRYHELLPVREAGHVVSLGEGMTPLLAMPRLGEALGVPNMLMKDEGLLPGGTFKARGAAVGVSRAAELGIRAIAMPTNGNAGAAWSAYAARAGMRSLIVMPAAAPAVTRAICDASGAELYLVDGLIGDAGRLVTDALRRRPGYQNVATLNEPYRIEGKKTMGLEIAEQLGWRMPGVIAYPTGGGVGIIGIYKALRELLELGWVRGALPRLVAVQSAGCAPIVRAFLAGAREAEPWPEARTVAFGITVPKPLGDFLILEALYATGGTAVAVTDEALLADQREAARLEGCFVCPEGAACFTAVRQLRESGWLSGTEEVVVLNTGTGLIYPETVAAGVPVLPASGSIPALDGVPRGPGGARVHPAGCFPETPPLIFSAMSTFDPSVPNVARVYDYLLGGKDNFEVDRMMAARLVEIVPPLPQMLWDNRRFVARAVTWVAKQGVSQFIDLGAGFPTQPSVHESVYAVNASARVAYVDYDPVVVSHLNGLVASHDDRVIVIPGDVRDPGAVLAAVRGSGIDLDAPACVIIALVLHFIDAETAASVARQYTAALAPGSYVIITIGRGDGEVADRFNSSYNAEISGARLYNHSVAEFASFFSGLEVIPPGFTDAQLWRAGWQDAAEPGPAVGRAFAGVARVP